MSAEVLRERLNNLCDNIPKNQWGYFNKRTIENYINNIESIQGYIDKSNTITIISNYLDDVELNFDPNIYYAIDLNNKYLIRIRSLYRQLGFALVPPTKLLLALLVIAILVAFIIKQYFYLEIFYVCIVCTIFLRMLIKHIQHKGYGVNY
jgi:hypothetical protein